MIVEREYLRKTPVGVTVTINCPNAAELDSTYQTALKARKELGLDKDSMRITRLAKEMVVEVERKESQNEPPENLP